MNEKFAVFEDLGIQKGNHTVELKTVIIFVSGYTSTWGCAPLS